MRVHISLGVQDLDAAKTFYRNLFDQEASKSFDDYANFRLDEPPIHLALQRDRQGENRTAAGHFGIELPDLQALAGWRERMEAAGVDFRDQQGAQCCYASGDKLWVSDPDGHQWEIWVRTGESERLEDRELAGQA